MSSPGPASDGARRLLTVLLIFLCQGTLDLSFFSVSLFMPEIQESLALSFTQAGLLLSASSWMYALLQVPVGSLSDRRGAAPIFLAGLLGGNVVCLLFALVDAHWQAMTVQGVFGIFRAFTFVPGMILMAEQFPPERRTTAMGLFVSITFVSRALLGFAGPLINEMVGWRGAFVLFPGAGLAMAGLLAVLRPPGPRLRTVSAPRASVLEVARSPIVMLSCLIQFVRGATLFGLTSWLTTFLVDQHDMPFSEATLLVSGSAIIIALSTPLGGYLSDRLARGVVVIVVCLAMESLLIALIGQANAVSVVPLVLLGSLFMQTYFAPLFALPMQVGGIAAVGTVNGVANLLANLGGIVSNYSLGRLRDATGSFEIGFWTLSAMCAFAALALLLAAVAGYLAPRERAGVRAGGTP